MLEDYTIEKEFINSSYAWVHFGVRKTDQVNVAIKFNQNSDQESITRFELENQILQELSDEDGVVDVFTGIERGPRESVNRLYYVMERLDYNLEKWLDTVFTSDNDRLKLDVVKQIYSTIKTIHERGYVHRDLHEGNVLINTINDTIISKITDFGRAYNLEHPTRLSKDGRPAWGLPMLPPEISFGVISAEDSAYKKGDYYAAGMLVKFIFTGGFDAESILNSIRGSLTRYQQKATGQLSIRYLSIRSDEEKRADYEDWCNTEASRIENLYAVNLDSDDMTKKITNLIKMSSSLDYQKRESDPNKLIEYIKGI